MAPNPFPPRWRAARALAALAAALLLGGCGWSTRLFVKDDAPIAAARATWRLGEAAGFEVGAARVRATGPQQLQNAESADLGGQRVDGPVELQHRALHEHGYLAYRHRIPLGSRFELEWLAGATAVRTRWQTTSARATDPVLEGRVNWRGAVGGVGGRLKLDEQFSLEVRGHGAAGVRNSLGEGDYTFGEVVFAWRPAPSGLVLRGGFAQLSALSRGRNNDSEQWMRVRGPYLNLGLEF